MDTPPTAPESEKATTKQAIELKDLPDGRTVKGGAVSSCATGKHFPEAKLTV